MEEISCLSLLNRVGGVGPWVAWVKNLAWVKFLALVHGSRGSKIFWRGSKNF